MSKILKLSALRPDTALENLNRLTGLDFQQWPESLLDERVDDGGLQAQEDARSTARQEPRKQCGQQG